MLFDFKNAKNGRLFAILTLKHVNADREYWLKKISLLGSVLALRLIWLKFLTAKYL